MGEPNTPPTWFHERLSFSEKREIRDPDETLKNHCLMLNMYAAELRRQPPDKDDPDTRNFFRWMSSQIHDMVKVSDQSSSICLFETGPKSISGREYTDGKMFGKVPISMHDVLFFDDAIRRYVPDSFPNDLMPGFADSNQLFYIDIQRNIAVSANQTLTGLLNGGSIEPYSRLRADDERRRQPGRPTILSFRV